ncbi:PH domain-containing protein [Pleionea litopenaei]|uniref:PH domain-containing protein n=1 Tax=Pleionea litopenaei TaxID=3070815 RepID=A0AA51RX88_9GAMM|nr:PH domain-containing protein [Pleionea sp. HL-JVS1]WMS89195.1 PH domain-containing protein [Pleionea sp. HL-JVS1]
MNETNETILTEAMFRDDQPLAEKTLSYFKVVGIIRSVFLVILALIGTSIALIANKTWPSWWMFLVFILGVAIVVFWFVFYLPKRAYQHSWWRFEEQGLFIYRGIFIRKQYAVPRSRVQHIDVAQGPLQRNFNISELIVHTAGTINASVHLIGLPPKTAEFIRDQLLNQDESDAV